MSKLYPEGSDKSLIKAIVNYLESICDKYESKLSEEDMDAFTIAKDTLSEICENTETSFTLEDLYDSYDSSKIDYIKEKKFLDFCGILCNHNFFDGCEQGSKKYLERLEKARVAYNKKNPNNAINSLNSLDMNKLYNVTSKKIEKKENIVDGKGDKKKADAFKDEGNKLLAKKKFDDAIEKYKQAIEEYPNNAVYYSNMAAAYSYKKDYKTAAKHARRSTEIDPKYVKAYVRLGLAEFELQNYEKAHDAYAQAVRLTSPNDKNWEHYVNRQELCKQKMDIDDTNENNNNDNDLPDLGNLGNLFGGKNPNDLLNSLGGSDGLAGLMKNPMMQQMAQNLMKNPDMMKNMMSQMGGGAGGMPNFGNNNNNNNNNDNKGGIDPELQKIMMEGMQNPEKAKSAWQRAKNDPEVIALMQNPEYRPIMEKFQQGDNTAMLEVAQKPELMKSVQRLLKKYWK